VSDVTFGAGLGLKSLVLAFKRLVSTPKLWPYALVPCLTPIVLLALIIVFGAAPAVQEALTWSGINAIDTWYGKAGETALSAILWLTSGVLALWVAIVLTPPLCAPALERLVRGEEEAMGAPPRARLSPWQEVGCGLQAQLMSLAFGLGVWVVLTLVNVLLPALVVLTLPLKVLAVAVALAWTLLDYPLTLRGITVRQRLRLFAAQPLAVLGFGLPFAVLFWVPCTSVVLLPVGAMAATRVVWQLASRAPAWRAALGAPTSPNGLLPKIG
jgi:CysZ protein